MSVASEFREEACDCRTLLFFICRSLGKCLSSRVTTKSGEASGRSGIVVEMFRVGGSNTEERIVALANAIIYEEHNQYDWNHSHIINFCKRKYDAVERGTYREFKLLDEMLEVIESVLVPNILDEIIINSMRFHAKSLFYLLRYLQSIKRIAQTNLHRLTRKVIMSKYLISIYKHSIFSVT